MKTILTIAAVAGLVTTASANIVVSDFNDNSNTGTSKLWSFDYGDAIGTSSWDGAMDADGNPASGAMKFDMNFDAAYASNKSVFTVNQYYPGIDVSLYGALEFDVYVDGASVQDAYGNYGYSSMVPRNSPSWTWVGGGANHIAPPADQWNHYSIPMSNFSVVLDDYRAMSFQLWGGGGQAITGNIIMYLDNVVYTPAPASLGVLGLGLLGVRRRR